MNLVRLRSQPSSPSTRERRGSQRVSIRTGSSASLARTTRAIVVLISCNYAESIRYLTCTPQNSLALPPMKKNQTANLRKLLSLEVFQILPKR